MSLTTSFLILSDNDFLKYRLQACPIQAHSLPPSQDTSPFPRPMPLSSRQSTVSPKKYQVPHTAARPQASMPAPAHGTAQNGHFFNVPRCNPGRRTFNPCSAGSSLGATYIWSPNFKNVPSRHTFRFSFSNSLHTRQSFSDIPF